MWRKVILELSQLEGRLEFWSRNCWIAPLGVDEVNKVVHILKRISAIDQGPPRPPNYVTNSESDDGYERWENGPRVIFPTFLF